MNVTVENIMNEALDLPIQVRAFVAEKLIESLGVTPEPELSKPWQNEIRKRCREMDQGFIEFRNAEDVFATAYSTLT
jgi:hypothetical protein